MPHIVVEYSQNLQAQVKETGLLAELHRTVIASGLFSPEAVKARGVAYEDYVLTGEDKSFLHVNVAILEGRPLEAREALMESVFAVLQQKMTQSDKISVNIHEMTRETYKKS
jgi:5-carboxymethyl-2-hydroxymuconate isomerase